MPESIVTQLGLGKSHIPRLHSSFVQISPYFNEGFRVVFVGAVFDLTRRISEIAWYWLVRSFTVTAIFESEDEAYKWITEWLEGQPSYSTSREFEAIAKPRTAVGINPTIVKSTHRLRHSPPTLALYPPARDTSHWLLYRFRPLRVSRFRSTIDQYRSLEVITLTMFSITQAPLKQLIEDAGAQFRARDLTGITIYMADQYGNWKRLTSKPHRNYASVVLEPKVKEDLFGDVKEFLEGKEWYAQRGIPYRRGYLLFGTPGSGKTSSIHALASELGLDIYIVPLSLKAIDDAILSDLITSMPQACILLYEDIDAAFGSRTAGAENAAPQQSGVTLSGLLNTIDGVQAQEGCLLFATTNHPEHLDPALIRPGRMDVKIEYRHATQWQAEQLFRLFYPVESSGEKLPVERAARAFAQSIPESRLSVAQLQGFLMRFKGYPEDAARDAKSWVEVELAGAS